MQIRGMLEEFRPDVWDANHLLTFKVADSEKVMNNYDFFKDKLLRITVEEWDVKKSLRANALFHKLVQKIADATGESFTRVKNELVTSYGQVLIIDGNLKRFSSDLSPSQVAEIASPHLLFECFEEGKYHYIAFKSVRNYSKSEMARLIDGAIRFAVDVEAETGSSLELSEVMEVWKAE